MSTFNFKRSETRKGLGGRRSQWQGQLANLEDAVYKQAGLSVGLKIDNGKLKVITDTYADFVLAKSIIKGRTAMEVERE